MKLRQLFKGKNKNEKEEDKDSPEVKSPTDETSVEEPAVEEQEQASSRQAVDDTPTPAEAQTEKSTQSEEDIDFSDISSTFSTIQSLLGEDEVPEEESTEEVPDTSSDTVNIPCSAFLEKLPTQFRGSNWDDESFPDVQIPCDSESLLQQLKNGHVMMDIQDVAHLLPAGWVTDEAEGEVELDLAQVVASVPPELMQPGEKKSENLREAEQTADLFKAKRPKQKTAPEEPPAEEAETDTSKMAGPVSESSETPEPPQQPEQPAAQAETGEVTTEHEHAPADAEETEQREVSAQQQQEEIEQAPVQPKAEAETTPSAAPAASEEKSIPVSTPDAGEEKTAAEPEPETPPATTSRKSKIPEPQGWSGVDEALALSVGGVDLNTADTEQLADLQGIGEKRAAQIVQYRDEQGPFNHIYELMKLPGIGANRFRRATGLSPRNGKNRQEKINKMLGFSSNENPSLKDLITSLTATVHADGCVLSTSDGEPLAVTGNSDAAAEHYAAFVTQLFRRTSKYLKGITGADVECISLPMASPSLLLFNTDNIYLVIVQETKLLSLRDFHKSENIVQELGWLMGTRAVVREI